MQPAPWSTASRRSSPERTPRLHRTSMPSRCQSVPIALSLSLSLPLQVSNAPKCVSVIRLVGRVSESSYRVRLCQAWFSLLNEIAFAACRSLPAAAIPEMSFPNWRAQNTNMLVVLRRVAPTVNRLQPKCGFVLKPHNHTRGVDTALQKATEAIKKTRQLHASFCMRSTIASPLLSRRTTSTCRRQSAPSRAPADRDRHGRSRSC